MVFEVKLNPNERMVLNHRNKREKVYKYEPSPGNRTSDTSVLLYWNRDEPKSKGREVRTTGCV